MVNTVGDIIDSNGKILAGALKEGKLIAANDSSIRWKPPEVGFAENTLLAVIITNARLDKIGTFNLSRRAQHAISRTVIPAGTSYDGDIIFALSRGMEEINFDILCEMAIVALHRAILNAVLHAESIAGFPSASSIRD